MNIMRFSIAQRAPLRHSTTSPTRLMILYRTISCTLYASILGTRTPSVRNAVNKAQRRCGLVRQVMFLTLVIAFLKEAQAQLPNFTQSFDPSVGKIEVDPWQNWCIFHKSETIGVKTSDGSAIRVFDL